MDASWIRKSTAISLFVLFFFASRVSSANIDRLSFQPWDETEKGSDNKTSRVTIKRQWTKKLPGVVSNVAISEKGMIWASTIPEYSMSDTLRYFALFKLNRLGGILWEKKMKFAVRELALSSSGRLGVVSTYGDELIGLNYKGDEIWNVRRTCKPYILERFDRILCYHDEDVDSHIAFDIYSMLGKKLKSYPIEGDIVALKTSYTSDRFVIGLSEGRIEYFYPSGKRIWKNRVDGEVIDVAVSSNGDRRILALVRQQFTTKIFAWNSKGERVFEKNTPFQAIQVEVTLDGNRAILYGDLDSDTGGEKGQRIAGVALKEGIQSWLRGNLHPSVYFHSLSVGKFGFTVGVERNPSSSRKLHAENEILYFSPDGKVKDRVDLLGRDQSFYYRHRTSENNGIRWAGVADDGYLSYFTAVQKQTKEN